MNIVLPSRERVEELIVRLQTINEESWRPGRNAWIDDVIAILRDYTENTKAGVADETGRGFTYAPPVPTRGEGANPSPGLSDEDERALKLMDDAIGDAYQYRQRITTQKGYTDAEAKKDADADESALAHLRRRLGGAK